METRNYRQIFRDEQEREKLIEAIGIKATNKIFDLDDQIQEIVEYFGLVRNAHTIGFKLDKDSSLKEGQAPGDPQNSA